MEQIKDQIRLFVATKGSVSASDILKEFLPYSNTRDIYRYLKELKIDGLKHGRIRGSGTKRARYSLPDEEKIKNDMWVKAVPIKFNPKKPKVINVRVTQESLTQMISVEKKFYEKELKKLKKEPYSDFVFWHLAVLSGIMTHILQLTWAINSDVFSKSENKLERAYKNRIRFEKFLDQVMYNLKARDEEKFKTISSIAYNQITHMPLIDIFFPAMSSRFEIAVPKAKTLH